MVDSIASLGELDKFEPKQKPPIVKEEQSDNAPKENVFHQRIADKFNDWRKNLITQIKIPRKEIFKPENFEGDWTKADAADYFVHKLSVIGLPDNKEITAEDISKAIAEYNGKAATKERISFTQECYAQFNTAAQKYGLDIGIFEHNRVYFLSEKRIAEIVGSREDRLACTLPGATREILITADNEELNYDPNQMYDVIVHELGHLARDLRGLNKNKDTDLEEGIIQAQARLLEKSHGKESRRTAEIYSIQADVAEQLAIALGAESLFGMNYHEIREKMITKYKLPGQISDPYDNLIYDLILYRRKFDSFNAGITEETPNADVLPMNIELRKDRQAMNRIWGFKLN